MEEEIIYQKCAIQFTKKKNVYAHVRKVHDEDPIEPKDSKNIGAICDICGKQFVNNFSFSRHMNQIHQNISERNRHSRIKCYECLESFVNHEDLRKHITSVHKVEIEYNEFRFESSSGFCQWKDQFQDRSLSCYVLDTVAKVQSDGSKKEYYNCHRSHNYISKGKSLRAFKSKGTNKINKTCRPSRMEVVTENSEGSVLVKFWMTHLGHSLDIGRIFLSKTIRGEIAGKLKEGLTYEHILDGIRDGGFTKEESRLILLLEKKDMHNIARDFRINYSTKLHQNDAISIKLWVEDMKKLGDECPVLFYKEQGVECDLGILDTNDFALILMTSFQAQQMFCKPPTHD